MFTEASTFNDIVGSARKDVRDFFQSDFKIDFDHTSYKQFLDTLRQIDSTFFTHEFNNMKSLDFVDKLVKWLEDTRKKPTRYPWTIDPIGNLTLSKDEQVKKIESFLNHLKHWINQLISPGNVCDIRPKNPFHTGQKLWAFEKFIGKQRLIKSKWDIIVHEANEDDKKLMQGFVSWLVLVKNEPVLYIIYDKEQILNDRDISSLNEWIVCRSRNRRIRLHELGHARVELSWYLDHVNAAQKTTFVCSHPLHEYEAWIYALTIRTLLVSIRSRITRFIENGDYEWLSFV